MHFTPKKKKLHKVIDLWFQPWSVSVGLDIERDFVHFSSDMPKYNNSFRDERQRDRDKDNEPE